MRTLQTKGRSKNKTIVNRIGKIGLLALLFIFVFALVCILLDTNVSSNIQNGTFDNVAYALDGNGTFTTYHQDGEYTEGTNESSSIGTTEVWTWAKVSTLGGGTVEISCNFYCKGKLKTFVEAGVTSFYISFKITNKRKNGNPTFEAYANNSKLCDVTTGGNDTNTHSSDACTTNTSSTIWLHFWAYGSSAGKYESEDHYIVFSGKTYTITVNGNGGSNGVHGGATGGSVLSSISTGSLKNGKSPVGYYLGTEDDALKLFNADGSIVKGVTGYTTADGEWIHDGNTTVYARWPQPDFGVTSGKSRDNTWGSASNPFLIENLRHLNNLAGIVNHTQDPYDSIKGVNGGVTAASTNGDYTYAGLYFKVTSNITSAFNTAIGNSSYHFKGIFDGNSKSITISISGSEYVGLFGYIDGATIKNLTIATGSTVTGSARQIGGFIGYATGACVIDNCINNANVTSTSTSGSWDEIGGILGNCDSAGSMKIKNCTNNGNVTGKIKQAGGIAGFYQGTFEGNNYNYGTVVGVADVGGIIGKWSSSGSLNGENHGSVSGSSQVGGIVGTWDASGSASMTVTNNGTVSGSSADIGGIVGNSKNGEITNSKNKKAVGGPDDVGGIVGEANHTSISSCENDGTVTSSGGFAGGIVGYANGSEGNLTSINGCTNKKAVSANRGNYVGGIVAAGKYVNIIGCTNNGEVHGSANYVGGVLGATYDASVVNFDGTIKNTAKVTGRCLIGGIAGYLVATANLGSASFVVDCSTDRSDSSTAANCVYIGTTNGQTNCFDTFDGSHNGTYVGGIFGLVIQTDKTNTASFSVTGPSGTTSNATSHSDFICAQDGIAGGLFGMTVGGTYNGASMTASCEIDDGEIIGSSNMWCIGGIVGANRGAVLQPTSGSFNGRVISRRNSIENTHNMDSNGKGAYVGGIAGYNSGTIKNINHTGGDVIQTNSRAYIGGVCGLNTGTIDNCANSSSYIGWESLTIGAPNSEYVGGIVGLNKGSNGIVKNCINSVSTVKGKNQIGGIVGRNESTNSGAIDKCTNSSGTITSSNQYVGGIVGYNNSGTINGCKTTAGTISASSDCVGGIAGQLQSGTIQKCYAACTLSNGSDNIGGIAGYITSGTIQHCYTKCSIYDKSDRGGIIGYVSSSITISHCYNESTLTNNNFVPALKNGKNISATNVVTICGNITVGSMNYNEKYCKVIPSYTTKPLLNGTALDNWENIIDNNVNGYQVKMSNGITSGYYYKITTPENTTTSIIGDANSVTSVSSTAISSITSASSPLKIDVNCNYASNNVNKNILIDTGSGLAASGGGYSKVYDAEAYNGDISISGNSMNYAVKYKLKPSGGYIDVGTYNEIIYLTTGSTSPVLGYLYKASAVTITKRTLNISVEWENNKSIDLVYSGSKQGLKKITISNIPSAVTSSETNNGLTNVYSFTNPNSLAVSLTSSGTAAVYGITAPINAGSYSFAITLSDTTNYTFSGTTSYSWTIQKYNVQNGILLVFNGTYSSSSPVISGINGHTYAIPGTSQGVKNSDATSAGSPYSLYLNDLSGEFVLNSTSNSFGNEFLVFFDNGSSYDDLSSSATYTFTIDTATQLSDYSNVSSIKVHMQMAESSNYTGSTDRYFYLIRSDFAKLSGKSGKWGSTTNPYVISNQFELTRLKDIVNGSTPWDSVSGTWTITQDGTSHQYTVSSNNVQASQKTYAGCTFIVTSDISYASAKGIGDSSSNYFAGTIYGSTGASYDNSTQRYAETAREITLTINSAEGYTGLFGNVNGGTLRYITTKGSVISSTGDYVGGLIAYANGNANIYQCSNQASVTGSGNGTGGFVGYAHSLTISSNITNTGTISGNKYVGGIIGYSNNVTYYNNINGNNYNNITINTNKYIENSGAVMGNYYVGGIAGFVSNNSIITNTNFKVTATGNTSAIVGKKCASATNPVSDGLVPLVVMDDLTINGSYVGGIFGLVVQSGTMYGIYWFNGSSETVSAYHGVAGGLFGASLGGTYQGTLYSTGEIDAEENKALIGDNNAWSGTTSWCEGGISAFNTADIMDNSNSNPTNRVESTMNILNRGTGNATYGGAFLGGLFGYNSGTITVSTLKRLSGEISSACTTSNRNYVGGIVGYNTGTLTSPISGGFVYGGYAKDYTGGIAGYNSGTITNPYSTFAISAYDGATYVGGVVGYNIGTISGTVYCAPNGYNNNTSINGSTTGNYVGGFIGANINGILNGVTQITINGGVVGKNYVGGYIGASKFVATPSSADDNNIRIGTNSSITGTITIGNGGSYVGGAFGYIYAGGSMTTSTERSDSGSYFRFQPSTINASLVLASGATSFGSYVGGIVGYCAGISIENGEGNDFTAWTVKNSISGQFYVGGAIGYMTTYPTATEVVATSLGTISGLGASTPVAVNDTVSPGNHYSLSYTKTVTVGDDTDTITITYYFVPTIYGTVSRTGDTIYVTDNNPFTSGDSMTFRSTSISGWYKNDKQISGTTYVGGLIGRIDTGVGNYVSSAYARGASGSKYIIGVDIEDNTPINKDLTLKLQNTDNVASASANTGIVTGKYFVGGTIGTLLNNYNSPIKYTTNIKAVLSNSSQVTTPSGGGWYIGGLIGSVGTYLDADALDSYGSIQVNGSIFFDSNDSTGSFSGHGDYEHSVGSAGSYYVGGVAGFINANGDNRITYFVNTYKVIGSWYVGGLVGSMAGGNSEGTISSCVSTPNDNVTISVSTDYYNGTYYVGGLVGDAGAIVIVRSYALGFNFDNVNSDRGGVVGRTTSSTILENVWAIHYVNALTYTTTYRNANGKFILIDPSYAYLPNYDEILVTTGLKNSVGAPYASVSGFAAAYDHLSIKAVVPNGNENYLVFYNTTGVAETNPNRYTHGTDDTSFDGSLYGHQNGQTNYLYSKTKSSANSFILAKAEAKFVNLVYDVGKEDQTPISNWVDAFNNGRISNEYTIESISFNYYSNTGKFVIEGIVYYNNIDTGNASDKWKVGSIRKELISGGSDTPIPIEDATKWKLYAANVRGDSQTPIDYYGKYFKLINDIDLGTYSNSNNFLFGTTSNVFCGSLDGNGKTLTYSISGGSNLGLFPSIGAGATIKNLYLKGTLTSSGNNAGALIGTAPNSCTIQNIRSYVDVSGTYSVGGIIGTCSANLTIIDIVNSGTITASTISADGGAGGLIGSVTVGSSSVDSARNAGYVYGPQSIGGIVGLVKGTLIVKNSCNTGYVETNYYANNTWSYAGGIAGKITADGSINVYACYNSGRVWGKNGRVGGIIGCDTDVMSTSSGKTNIFYCFNSGEVISGTYENCSSCPTNNNNNLDELFTGGECGGIIGMAIQCNIYYCYNIGDITCFGVVFHISEFQARVGGLVGLWYRYHKDTTTCMEYCYNAGTVNVRSTIDNVLYASGLVGCCIWQRSGAYTLAILIYWNLGLHIHEGQDDWNNEKYLNNYSMHGQVNLGNKNGTVGTTPGVGLNATKGPTYSNFRASYKPLLITYHVDHNIGYMESCRGSDGFLHFDAAYWADAWTLQDTLVDATGMVGRYDETNQSGKIPSQMTGWQSKGGEYGSHEVLTSGDITHNTKFGYIYLPGCLPQLSVFATDTETGIAMTGYITGYNIESQTYILKPAGSEFSPYVIQNGIDLLGLSQLCAIDNNSNDYYNYHAASTYFSFADGYNNLDARKLETLDMNTLNLEIDQTNDKNSYTAYGNTTTTTSTMLYEYDVANGATSTGAQSFYSAHGGYGKNILLFRNKNNNDLNNYDGKTSSYGANFYQIASKGIRYFAGTIKGFTDVVNGEQISYPEIRNLKITNSVSVTDANENNVTSCYAAFVGYGKGCTLENFAIGTGSTIKVEATTSNAMAAGFIAKAMNNGSFTGLQMHSGSTVKIVKTNSGTSYLGGIVGYARPNLVASANASGMTEIDNCTSCANIDTSETTDTYAYVGGILGYAHGLSTAGTAGVYVKNSSITGGTIYNGSNAISGIGTGGIVGGRNSIGKVDITGCKVGSGSSTTTIKGANSVGGIISYTNGDTNSDLTTIKDCEILSNAVLQRPNKINSVDTQDNATYNSAFGGFVGYSTKCRITGDNTFNGTINTSAIKSENIGGLIGYMGTYTTIQGTIRVYGIINTGSTLSENIGGAVGFVPSGDIVNIDGTYYINPQTTTSAATNVGGFIGYNAGTIHILGTSSILDIRDDTYSSSGNAQVADDTTVAKTTSSTVNSITADTKVGGFIGCNASTGTIYVGHQEGDSTGAKIGTFTATLVANVSGSMNVGGFVGYNAGLITTVDSKCYVVNTGKICSDVNGAQHIGGIVGYNAASGNFNIAVQENYFENAGKIGNKNATQANKASYVGGIVGNTLGQFTNVGTLVNTGDVYGNQYVGGSIGYFPDGELAGTMINGKAKSVGGNLVSDSNKTGSGSSTQYITIVTANASSGTTEGTINLYNTVTANKRYSYSIGKTVYYFIAPISGTVIGMDFEKVAISGDITAESKPAVDINSATSLYLNDNQGNIINTNTTYKYSFTSGGEYYYNSAYYGAVYNISANDPDSVKIYPTLKAIKGGLHNNTSNPSDPDNDHYVDAPWQGVNIAIVTQNQTITEGYKEYPISNDKYFFDATNITGTIKEIKGENVIFSELKITAFRNELQGVMPLPTDAEKIIYINQNYSFLVGTTRYFFTSPVTGTITNIVGNVLTIGPYTKKSMQMLYANNPVVEGREYIYTSGENKYGFKSLVSGKATNISGSTVTLSFNETAGRSALSDLVSNWAIGGSVKAGKKYKLQIGASSSCYFVAPYSGDVTQIYESNGVYYVGITNTDYSDMVADDTVVTVEEDPDASGYTAGYVNGFNDVGGVVAIVESTSSVGFYTENGSLVEGVYTRLINFGTVASSNGTNVGGSIGSMRGKIKGYYEDENMTEQELAASIEAGMTLSGEQQYIEFYNYGLVYVKENGGGSIGVFSGQGAWARMFNYSDTTIMGSELTGTITSYANIGGCIGLVQKVGDNPVILRNSIMVNSGVVSAQTNRLTVNSTNVTGECIGGVIGKISDGAVGNTKDNWSVDLYSDGSVIAGRTINDSANYAPMNYVGGLIGYIGATPVILKSVLNYTKRSGGSGTSSGSYVTYVSGHHYVGGIVGYNNSTVTGSTDEEKASIRYCYNVGGKVISDDYTYKDANNSSGTCGGIVGGIGPNKPLTYCCYWISPFGNDALKNATVSQLGTSLTSTWVTHFTAYDISLLQYSPTSWEDYLYIYDEFYYAMHSNTYQYDYYRDNGDGSETYVGRKAFREIILDTSNTYSTDEKNKAISKFNQLVLDVEFGEGIYEYGGEDIAPISAQEFGESAYETLKQKVAARKGFDLSKLEENTDNDLGIHIGGDTSYSTGNDNTGYFFAYASDAVSGGFSQHEIQTEHTNAGNTPDFDLNVWKYISQAFGASDVGQSSSQLIYNYTATDDSYEESSTLHHTSNSKSNGNTQINHIYAKTYAPNVNGYYLYAYAVNKEGFVVSYDVYDDAIYMDADSKVCKNVLIFFKKVNLGSVKLTYNSLERYAPITGLTNIEKKDQQYTYYKLDPSAATGYNFGTDAGTYKVDGDIYYVPNKAYVFTASTTELSNPTSITASNTKVEAGKNYTYKINGVGTDYYFNAKVDGWVPTIPTSTKFEILSSVKIGSVLSGENDNTYTWKINPRKLVITNNNLTTTYDNTAKSATLVITQIVGNDVADGTYALNNLPASLYPEFNPNPTIGNPYPSFSAVVAQATSPSSVTSSTGASPKDGGYCTSSTPTYQLKTYTLTITAVNAGTYKLKASAIKGTKKDNYQMSSKEAELQIDKKVLTATWNTQSYTWDGSSHSISLDLSGWAVGESTNSIKNWTDGISFSLSKENTSASGSFTKGSATTTPSGDTSSTTTKANVTFSATAKNKYMVNWTSGAAVGTNYLMPTNSQGSMTIATLQIVQNGSPSTFGTITYDGLEHSVSIRLKSIDANGNPLALPAATIKTIYDTIKNTNAEIVKSGAGPSGVGVVSPIDCGTMQTSKAVLDITVTYKLKNAGEYICKINQLGSASGDYFMENQSIAKQTISQKSLTVTPTGENISTSSPGTETIFNNVNIGLTKVEVTGFVNSEASSYASVVNAVASGFTYSAIGSGSKATYTIATKNVGNYSIVVSPIADTNYTFVAASWYWKIKTRNITAQATWSTVDTSNNETTTSESLSATASAHNYTYSTYPQGLKLITFGNLASGHTAQDIISTTPSSNITATVSGNELTVKEVGQNYNGTDDAGTYTLNIGYNGTDGNYTIDFNTGWVISPVSIKAKSNISANTEAYYNGQNHDVTISYQIGESTLSGNVYGQDTISGSNAQIISGGSATTNVCNVGVYTLTIASSVGSGGITASRGASTDKSANYVLDTSGFSSNVTYTVLPLRIDFVWSETNTFVYNGQTHKVALTGIKLFAGDTCVSGESPITPKTTPTDIISGTTTTTYNFVGITANETLTIVVVSDESVNYLISGNYTSQASYSDFRVSGTNTAGIDTIADNYTYNTTNNEFKNYTSFTIYKSILNINTFIVLATISKIYDGTTDITDADLNNNPIKDYYATATFVSTNGGANTPTYSISNARYSDANVGTGKTINYSVSVSDNNYSFSPIAQSGNNGIITPRVLNVDLYLKNNKTATKQYDDTELYGTATNVNGQTSVRSASYRLGKGFTVSNIISSETSGHVIVTGMYRETTASRRVANGQTGEPSYNKYVNNVVYNAGTYSINKNAGYYKELVFTISGEKAGNYLLQVTTPAISGDPAAEVVVKDTRSLDASNMPDYELNIEITRTQIKIDNYGNTVQSYAQTNNVYTYQTEEGWLPVTAEKPARVSNLLNITIDNTWMYEGGNPANGWAHITAYKRIVGGSGKPLYAYLTGSQGMNMNYELKNQPTLVIDYFVVEDTEHYQISTLAGLMLASYYYNNYATIGEESGSDASIIYTWTVICTEEQYNSNPESYQAAIEEHDGYFDPEAPYPGDATKTGVWGYWAETPTDPIKYDKFRLMADISGVMTSSDYDILKNAFGVSPTTGNPIWGYGNTYLTNFVQTKVGNQVTVIGNIFADTFVGEFDGNGYVIKNFNVLYNVATEEATTINVGFFGYATNTANVYDMNLRDISINVYDSTSYANVINVGGLIGLSDMAKALTDTTIHASISVYASGTNKVVNVGGVVGFYVGTITDPDAVATKYNIASAPFTFPTEYDVNVAIENAIAVGSITVNNAGKNNLGGVVGVMRGGEGGAAVFSPVTLNEIQSRAGTTLAGGIIGYVNPTYTFSAGKITSFTQNVTDLAVENETKYVVGAGVAQYLQDSILVWTDANTSTFVNKMIGNVTTTGSTSTDAGRKATGLTYTELAYNGIEGGYRRSQSHYINTSSNYIYLPENTVTRGIYDVISETTSGGTAKYTSYIINTGSAYTSSNPRESLRFVDIVYTYLLRLELVTMSQQITIETTNVNVRVYKQLQESPMLGIRRGTDHRDANSQYTDRILMAYSQHYALLRMFRFASFELTKQINLYTNNYNIVYSGAFYGHVYSDKVQVISSNAGSYTTRKVGTKTYTTLDAYVTAYQKFYGLTLEVVGGYYVYKDPAKINVGIMIQGETETMFEVEKNTIPYTRSELKTGG